MRAKKEISMNKKKTRDCGLRCTAASALFALLLAAVAACGIYDVDDALMAPYNGYMTPETLNFTGDDEPLLDGYNLWYRIEPDEPYQRCWYNNELHTPTIDKTGKATDQYTVAISLLSPQDSNYSFVELHDKEGTYFYFAVSSYGSGIAESGKLDFGRWPD
jgi:hypothetical protein